MIELVHVVQGIRRHAECVVVGDARHTILGNSPARHGTGVAERPADAEEAGLGAIPSGLRVIVGEPEAVPKAQPMRPMATGMTASVIHLDRRFSAGYDVIDGSWVTPWRHSRRFRSLSGMDGFRCSRHNPERCVVQLR